MKHNFKTALPVFVTFTALSLALSTKGQIQLSPITTSQVKTISISPLNTSISPDYLSSTNRYLKTATKSLIGKSSTSTTRSTVTLNRGGNEGTAPSQTTATSPVQDGSYSCITRNVNERTDYFRHPLFGQSEFIYPGALINATGIINNQLSYYVPPTAYQRQPYRISANLFTMVGTPANPTEMIGDNEDYSQASFRNAKSLIMNRNAGATPPVEVLVEYIEANTQEEVAVKLGYNSNVNIPAELTALLAGIPIGANVSASASTVASQINNKSRILLKINFNFYSIDASPTNDNHANFLSPVAGADIPNNIVYVSSVLYGTTGYVYFESNKSVSELLGVLSETVGISGPLNEGSASVSISAETRAKFTSTVTKMVAYGKGLGVPTNSSIQLTSLDNLLTLIGRLRNWGPDNQGSPIAYTMNFLKDGVQAVVSYGTQFQNKVCTQPELTNLKFDVELELDRFDVSNVRDLDGTEDLYGQVDFKGLKAGTRAVTTTVNLFSKTEANATTNNYRNGSFPVDKRIPIITNLTFDQLRNIELSIGGRLYDDEGILGSRVFKCMECAPPTNDYGIRTIKFIELSNTQTSLNSLLNNGSFQLLQFGGDQLIELNFYESGVENDGRVRFLWKV